MKSNTFSIVRFIAALFTTLLIVGQSHIPKKRLQIHPAPSTNISLDGYEDPSHGNAASWINQDTYSWRCHIPKESSVNKGCGVSLSWGTGFTEVETPSQEFIKCTSTRSDEDGDGWGWEKGQSCRMGKSTKVTAHVATLPLIPCASTNSDVDGDGIGMEYGQSCQIMEKGTKFPQCRHTDTRLLSNGWGWENNNFCKTFPAYKGTKQAENATYQQRPPFTMDGIDFSAYDDIEFNIHYEGRAAHLRIYLRHSNPEYTVKDNHNTSKFMALSVLSEDLTTGTLQAKLSNFSVAQWWSLNYPLPRRLNGPEFDNITSLGVDHIVPGKHKVRLDKIELTGQLLSMEDLIFYIAIFWATYLIIETLLRYYLLRKHSLLSGEEINHLTSKTLILEAEKNEYQELSITDSLTGIFNRSGIRQFTENLFEKTEQGKNLGLMILDIDHFKYVNDTHGHNTGDTILTSVTNLISSKLRDNDVFGRWGGEEFLLVCPHTNAKQLRALAEILREVIEAQSFTPQLQLKITISIGATIVKKGETFNEVFKRADIALYTAKTTRNKVSFQT